MKEGTAGEGTVAGTAAGFSGCATGDDSGCSIGEGFEGDLGERDVSTGSAGDDSFGSLTIVG